MTATHTTKSAKYRRAKEAAKATAKAQRTNRGRPVRLRRAKVEPAYAKPAKPNRQRRRKPGRVKVVKATFDRVVHPRVLKKQRRLRQ